MHINLLTVLLAAVVAFIIGFLLHGPIGGKLWTKLADIHPTGNEKFSKMIPQMISNLVTFFITAWALAAVYAYASTSSFAAPGIGTGVKMAVLVWLGFLVTSSATDVIWMEKKRGLWMYEAFASLIVMIAMGVIIAW
jgi:uncharacterized membrane protein